MRVLQSNHARFISTNLPRTAVPHTQDLLLKTGPFWGDWGRDERVCEISWNISRSNSHAEAPGDPS